MTSGSVLSVLSKFKIMFFFCMSCSNSHFVNATFLFLIDTHWHCCAFFLPFFHSFFLPVAWAIDLAVQGCKYHCGFFHSCPSTFTPTHSLMHWSPHALSHVVRAFWVAGVSAAWKISLHLALQPPYIPLCAIKLLVVPVFVLFPSGYPNQWLS